MKMLFNSIIGVDEARNKLKEAFDAHFKKNSARFEIGVDPNNGKYTVIAFVGSIRHAQALPPEVDGYKVFSSIAGKQPEEDF